MNTNEQENQANQPTAQPATQSPTPPSVPFLAFSIQHSALPPESTEAQQHSLPPQCQMKNAQCSMPNESNPMARNAAAYLAAAFARLAAAPADLQAIIRPYVEKHFPDTQRRSNPINFDHAKANCIQT